MLREKKPAMQHGSKAGPLKRPGSGPLSNVDRPRLICYGSTNAFRPFAPLNSHCRTVMAAISGVVRAHRCISTVKGPWAWPFWDYFVLFTFFFWVVLTPDEELWHLDFSRKFKFLWFGRNHWSPLQCEMSMWLESFPSPYSVLRTFGGTVGAGTLGHRVYAGRR